MAGLISKTTSDFAEVFEVQSDGWWMWIAGVLRATADSVERIVVNTYGVSSGGRVAPLEQAVSAAPARFKEKQIESRFTKLG